MKIKNHSRSITIKYANKRVRRRVLTHSLMILGMLFILMGCYERSNPIDPLSDNYIGHESVDTDGDGIGLYQDVDDIYLVAPEDGLIITDTVPDLETCAFNPETITKYWIQISNTVDFTGTLVFDKNDYASNACAVPVGTFSAHGKYYWRAKAWDGKNWSASWSGTWCFILVFSVLVDYNFTMLEVLAAGTTASFQMGSTSGGSDERPIHTVSLTWGYAMGAYEITQRQYREVMGSNPASGYGEGDNYPVYYVNWYDAVEFCNRLSGMEGYQTAYAYSGYGTEVDSWPSGWKDSTHDNITCDFTATGYRLPTEAEWEYAARGGDQSAGYTYAGSDTIGDVAWYGSNSGGSAHAVGGKQANELGLYDMSGNIWE